MMTSTNEWDIGFEPALHSGPCGAVWSSGVHLYADVTWPGDVRTAAERWSAPASSIYKISAEPSRGLRGKSSVRAMSPLFIVAYRLFASGVTGRSERLRDCGWDPAAV